jgi:hypothetical protein
MLKKELVLCLFLVAMGILDLVTTVLGVLYFGAVEINPLFAGIANSNILVFSGIKLATAVLVGFLFYKGFASEKTLGINSNIRETFSRVRILCIAYGTYGCSRKQRDCSCQSHVKNMMVFMIAAVCTSFAIV